MRGSLSSYGALDELFQTILSGGVAECIQEHQVRRVLRTDKVAFDRNMPRTS